jgi:hypothetical protein
MPVLKEPKFSLAIAQLQMLDESSRRVLKEAGPTEYAHVGLHFYHRILLELAGFVSDTQMESAIKVAESRAAQDREAKK